MADTESPEPGPESCEAPGNGPRASGNDPVTPKRAPGAIGANPVRFASDRSGLGEDDASFAPFVATPGVEICRSVDLPRHQISGATRQDPMRGQRYALKTLSKGYICSQVGQGFGEVKWMKKKRR